MSSATVVRLVSGEEVHMKLDSVCNQDQTFVRMGKRLIAGVVVDPRWQGIYIWQEVNGVYVRLGDIVFKDHEDGSVQWDMYAWVHSSPDFEQRAARFLAEQAEKHASVLTTGNHIAMLSVAPGIKL